MKAFGIFWAGALVLVGSLPLFAAGLAGQAITLSTPDGWELAAVYQPAKEDHKTVVLVHDLGKQKEAFAKLANALESAGYGYVAFDLRGHGASTNEGEAFSFAREGLDNEFNKMPRDVDAVFAFLKKKGVTVDETVLLGAGLGANVAAKSVSFTPDVPALALISPTTNTRDVLTIPAMRVYKGAVLIAAAADDKKTFLEASVIRNVAYLTTGPGKVTFLTAYDLSSHEMLDKYFIPTVLQWLSAPVLPEVKPDVVMAPAPVEDGSLSVPPSGTEDALFPSVLE